MSFDFSIKVRIKEKQTGDVISGASVIHAPVSLYDGYQEICGWYSSMFLDLPPAFFRICSQYTGERYPIEKGSAGNATVFVPRTALREICSYIYSRCCVPDAELTKERDWYWWDGYEVTNTYKAEELKNFLCSLDSIENLNEDTGIAADFITDPQKRAAFQSNPQGYEFEFMLDYHYCPA